MKRDVVKINETQLCRMIKESVQKVLMESMNELSPKLLKHTKDAFYNKYYPTDKNGYDWSKWQSLKTDENGHKLHPKDKKPMQTHLRNFSDAIDKAKKDMPYDNSIDAKAQELYKTIDNWEDMEMLDHIEHGYGDVGGSAVVEDENGEEWTFWASGPGHYDGGWLEFDEIEEVTYEAPNGQEGEIQNP